eukprot:COSAG05_NODE_6202_length_1001_cov_0.833703_1_plen_124_part_10
MRQHFNRPSPLVDVHFVIEPPQDSEDGAVVDEAPSVIYAHRLVLSGASRFFENLFLGDMAATCEELPVIVPVPAFCDRRAALLAIGVAYHGQVGTPTAEAGNGLGRQQQQQQQQQHELRKSEPE